MGIALCCVWAAYTTTELLKVAASTLMSPDVVVVAAESPGIVAFAAVFPEAMAPAAALLEVAAHAAESSEAVVLTSAPCMVVASSNVLSACRVAVVETVTELSLFSNETALEPPEVVASAAEPPEVSVVLNYELSSCPLTAMEAICESSSRPLMAMEAICKLSSCLVAARRAVPELSPCPVMAMEVICELSACPVAARRAISELSSCAEPVSGFELSVLPVSIKESEFELFVGPDLIIVSDVEQYGCPISIYESVFCPTSPFTTPEIFPELPVGSSSLVTAQKPMFELLTLPVMNSETINALYVCPVTPVIAQETINELSNYPVSVKKSSFRSPVLTKEPDFELSVDPVSVNEPEFELSACPISVSNPVYELSFCPDFFSQPPLFIFNKRANISRGHCIFVKKHLQCGKFPQTSHPERHLV